MPARLVARALAAGLSLAAACGSSSSSGNPSVGGGTGNGGGTGGTSTPLTFQLQRTSPSRDYTAAELDVARIVVFSSVPSVAAAGFDCDAAGGAGVATRGAVHVDLSSTGVTPVVTVSTSEPSVAELWLLVRARVTKHGKAHAAHGDLSCFSASRTLYTVLRFTPPSPVAAGASGATLTGTLDASAAVHEQGDCDRSCDEDDQHLENPDPIHGRILLAAEHPLDASVAPAGGTPPVAPAPAPPAGPVTTPGTPSGAVQCAAGQTCACADAPSCALECPGGNCNLSCARTGACNLTCTGGGCMLSCQDAGTCTETCPGGNCRSMSCNGAGVCHISSCGGSACNASCTNSGECRCEGGSCG